MLINSPGLQMKAPATKELFLFFSHSHSMNEPFIILAYFDCRYLLLYWKLKKKIIIFFVFKIYLITMEMQFVIIEVLPISLIYFFLFFYFFTPILIVGIVQILKWGEREGGCGGRTTFID
jgi:hypothetical protein